MSLTPKQQRFVAEYLIDLNATQAYIRAGYAKTGAEGNAARLIANDRVASAIAAGQARLSSKLEITAEKVLNDLEDARRNAMATLEWGPAIRACELQGKHIGMFVERTEGKVTILNTIDRPPQETREQWLARTQKELGRALGTTAGTAD